MDVNLNLDKLWNIIDYCPSGLLYIITFLTLFVLLFGLCDMTFLDKWGLTEIRLGILEIRSRCMPWLISISLFFVLLSLYRFYKDLRWKIGYWRSKRKRNKDPGY